MSAPTTPVADPRSLQDKPTASEPTDKTPAATTVKKHVRGAKGCDAVCFLELGSSGASTSTSQSGGKPTSGGDQTGATPAGSVAGKSPTPVQTAVPAAGAAGTSAQLPQGLSLETLLSRIQSLEASRAAQSADSVLRELTAYCGRREGAFSAEWAMSLVETLVATARREDHPKKEEFIAYADELANYTRQPCFRALVLRLFGSNAQVQAATKVAAFFKSYQATREATRPEVRPYPRPSSAFAAGERRRLGRSRGGCFVCGSMDHWARNCPSNNPEKRSGSTVSRDGN